LDAIDQVPFNFDPRIGLIVGIMVGFLVFAVALDLTWEQLRRVLKSPKAPAIGLLAQFGILPAVAFGAGVYLTDVPSVTLGLLLVTCCPGGALSTALVNRTTDRLVGMWESRVLCEICKSLWKPFCGFHGDAISTAVFGVSRDRAGVS